MAMKIEVKTTSYEGVRDRDRPECHKHHKCGKKATRRLEANGKQIDVCDRAGCVNNANQALGIARKPMKQMRQPQPMHAQA